eukprot:TRINITY_DN6390_c0_g1_i3.p1 TRINITY_DN6390_c0_g1~~TRINITY_DN6390_c0_g1_i3.p1  ORF type:complete len:1314 (-),score=172.02 TRINITY_DN6390_c0_g1_i3:281-4147(-)
MDSAGVLSQSLFLWVQPLMVKGFKRSLKPGEALSIPQRLQPSEIAARFNQLWADEKKAQGEDDKAPSLSRVLWKLVARDVVVAFFFQVAGVLMKFGCAFLLRLLMHHAAETNEGNYGKGLAIAAGLTILNAMEGTLCSLATFRMQLSLYGLMCAVSQCVLQKGLILHPDACRDTCRRGDLVTIALSDFGRIVEMSPILMQGVGAPFMLIFAFAFMIILLGPLVLVDIIAVVAVTFVIILIGREQGRSFRRKMMWQGRRLSSLNDMLQSIRLARFYTLEEHYQEQMLAHRKQEVSALVGMKSMVALLWPIAGLVPSLTVILVFSLHILIHDNLPSTPDVLAVLAIARFLYQPFVFLGSFLGAVDMLFSSIGRLRHLLIQREVKRLPLAPHAEQALVGETDLAIRIHNRSFSWSLKEDALATLPSLSLEVPRGELWVIVGELGSGKSSVLAALLGALSVVSSVKDSSAVDESIGEAVIATGPSRSYVAQEPLIINASVRDNILFGADLAGTEEEIQTAYLSAVEAAALEQDLLILPAGDATEIGEKGVNLSGGQKARIALARAVFAAKPGGLVLLDDPISAVDAHVGAHIFNKCIVEMLGGSTRLLVTNQLQFLSHEAVSQIIVMEDGRCVEQGTFRTLSMNEGGRLTKMLTSVDSGQTGENAVSKKDAPNDMKRSMIPGQGLASDQSCRARLSSVESKAEGAVTWKTLNFYFVALGGTHRFALLFLSSWLFHLAEVIPDSFLVLWQEDVLELPTRTYLGAWVGLSLCCFLSIVVTRMLWVLLTTKAARNIHQSVLHRLMHCPLGFFDKTPSGRIMNRLGEDQMLVDFSTALYFEVLVITMWQVFDQLCLSITARPWTAPFVVVFLFIFVCFREVHRRTTREVIRWWLVSKSPLFCMLEEMLSGTVTIHAFGREDRFLSRFQDALQTNFEWMLSKDATNLYIDQRLLLLSALLVGVMAAQMVLIPGHVSDVVGSVALIYALQLGFSLKTTCYFMVQAEGVLASSERIAELTNEPEQEPVRVLPEDEHLQASGWPGQTETVLAFEDVCLRYQPHLQRALDGITAQLLAGEKIGIVGRTGSGKSTIMGTIFRLFEIEKGRILLGGQDISRIGLRALRRQITIVPQDPILFSGCLRQNLDPLGVRTDDELRSVLSRCYLDELMQGLNGGLSAAVAEGGSNFSLGERQVLCLARALLRQAKVLCLDEATANIDPTNDKRIQDVLSNDFGDCLMLTIAHRLHTVIRYNRIMVLDAGRLAQLDTPANLLAEIGIFQGLANQAGITAEFCASGTVSI